MKGFMLSAAVVTLCASGLAIAQGVPGPGITLKPDDVIATRQAGMALTGGVSAAMKAGVAAGTDVKVFEDGAGAFVKWGKEYLVLFPDGTQTGHETKAKPEVWSDRAGFEKSNAAFVAASESLAAAAKAGDKGAFAAAYAETGKACGGCHRNYKAKD